MASAEANDPAALEQMQRSLIAHEWLLRALLTHLAMTDPQAFHGLIGGFAGSRRYGEPGEGGTLTREVTAKLADLLADVRESLG